MKPAPPVIKEVIGLVYVIVKIYRLKVKVSKVNILVY
jgi:hypothetical protein